MLNSMILMAEEVANEATVVNEFEQTLLRIFILIIMFGLGAGLTPKDFGLTLRRPWGLIIGWLTQFGVMPLTAYILIVTVLFPFSVDENIAFVALGALIMGSVPAGTTSNLFTYFSKGNLALSVMMTINSTLWAFIMTPLMLFIYANFLSLDDTITIEFAELATVIVGLIIPVGLGMLVRRLSYPFPNRYLGAKKLAATSGHPMANLCCCYWAWTSWNNSGLLDRKSHWPSPSKRSNHSLGNRYSERTASNRRYRRRIHRQPGTGQDLASSCTLLVVHRADFNRCHICIQKSQLGSGAEDSKPTLGVRRKQTPRRNVGGLLVIKPWKVLGKLTGVEQVSRHQIT